MCDKCDGQLLLLIGEIKGTVQEIKTEQGVMRTEITDLRKDISTKDKEQQDNHRDLEKDVTKFKLKTLGFASILGGVFGFLSKFIP